MRGNFKLLAYFFTILFVTWIAGGVLFTILSLKEENIQLKKADAIVVPTGAAHRISHAVSLLDHKQLGDKLLITGGDKKVNHNQYLGLNFPGLNNKTRRAITWENSAQNTRDNAVAIRNWAQEYNINSIIVVTSNYHKFRLFAEIKHQTPNIDIQISLVNFPGCKMEEVFYSYNCLKTLFLEYNKLLAFYIFKIFGVRIY
jgi:uncharacterized SAM-binding protein YcdF (DUF218 family)